MVLQNVRKGIMQCETCETFCNIVMSHVHVTDKKICLNPNILIFSELPTPKPIIYQVMIGVIWRRRGSGGVGLTLTIQKTGIDVN